MEQELYKHRSVSSCIKAAYDTVCNNAKTILFATWLPVLINAVVMSLTPVLNSKTTIGMIITAIVFIASIFTNALLFSKTATLLNGKLLVKNYKRFLLMSGVMVVCSFLIGIIIGAAFYLILQSAPDAATHSTLNIAIGVAVALAAIFGIALLPTAYSCMNYIYNEDSRWGRIFGHEYGVGLKSWGYLFMLHMLLAIIITLLYIPLFIVPNAIMMADFANASSMALGDADALPSGFKLMYYGAAVVAMFLMGYVMIWGHIAVYYAYGSIASKNANKQEAINNNQ